ncbi:MAG: winged helix-turn-helix domain-containing protein [Acidobacteria bacterium]|nr:winged helix-turn-helix domain-containing protein [Acidobacteriota bacterium]
MTYLFGPFRYDAAQRLLFRGDELVPLGPKTIDLLHVLVERQGRVVEKAELMQLVWPDARVEEIGLARNVSLLRKALGDESEEPVYIATVPKRGYRFVAEVRVEGDGAAEPEAARDADRSMRRPGGVWLWAGLGALVAGLGYYQFFVPSRLAEGAGGGAYVAVAPLACECDGGEEALAESYGDALVTELARRGGVSLAGPSTVKRYRWARVSMSVMGRLLGLDALVEGDLERRGGARRVNLRLVDVRTGRVIWAERFEGEAAEAGAVAGVLHARLTLRSGR